jgi:hypothetical protein
MQKEFTVNVPDELWVDSWDDGLTATYTYEGPQYFYIGFDSKLGATILPNHIVEADSETDPFSDEQASNFIEIITLDANENPDIAYMLYAQFMEHADHTFEDVANHDGSIYKKITNPHMHDYFELQWNNGVAELPTLQARVKDTSNILHTTAKNRLASIQKYNNAYDFDADDQATIDATIATFNTYIDTVSTAYRWKYTDYDLTEVPKIPAALQILFNQLPEID